MYATVFLAALLPAFKINALIFFHLQKKKFPRKKWNFFLGNFFFGDGKEQSGF
jgi:hypothetical protein